MSSIREGRFILLEDYMEFSLDSRVKAVDGNSGKIAGFGCLPITISAGEMIVRINAGEDVSAIPMRSFYHVRLNDGTYREYSERELSLLD